MTIAQTILAQLGGNRFCAMTGARDLVADAKALQFSIGRGAVNKANKVRVTLTDADLYDVEFYSLRGVNLRQVGRVEGVYAEDLARVVQRAADRENERREMRAAAIMLWSAAVALGLGMGAWLARMN
jgi:hypothetical protein